MADSQKIQQRDNTKEFVDKVGEKEVRKLRARRQRGRGMWFGLGMFGMVGWSVAVPALIGIAAGIWIDANWPSRFSWTLMLLVIGVFFGCWNAWYWVSRERKEIEKTKEE